MAAPRTIELHETPLSRFIGKRCDELAGRKSQRQIAQEAGFKSLQLVSMMRQGDAKLPLDRVPGLAKALEVDPAILFRLAMGQYVNESAAALDQIFGTLVTQNEADIVNYIREITNLNDPTLTDKIRAGLKKTFE